MCFLQEFCCRGNAKAVTLMKVGFQEKSHLGSAFSSFALVSLGVINSTTSFAMAPLSILNTQLP